MAFFRAFLLENHETPDTTFNERDEAALVMFLVQVRLNRSPAGVLVPEDFQLPDQVPTHLAKQVKFVAGFLCFFIAKPMTYMREMAAFRSYFIPGFASDRDKQIQLGQALRESFVTATLEDLSTAESLDFFFDVRELYETVRG